MNPFRPPFAALFLLAALAASRPLPAQEAAPAPNPTPAAAGSLPLETIVQRANHAAYYQGKDGRAQVTMTITDAQGRTRERQFTILRRDDQPQGSDDTHCADQKFYIYFQRPADVNKMSFLVWKQVERDDDRWLYLPALDLVKRIAASDKRTSFAGSDFFYEDVSGRNLSEDKHELVETTATAYVLKNTPLKPETVEFSAFTMVIDKATFLPLKTTFLDRNGQPYRIYEALETKLVQGHPTVVKAKMSDLRGGGHTVTTYAEVTYDLDLPESIFSERYLRAAPRKYLR